MRKIILSIFAILVLISLGTISASAKTKTIKKTLPVQKSSIICSYDAYNCSDFKTRAEAMKVFSKCGGVKKDIHRLDADKDGIACENLK